MEFVFDTKTPTELCEIMGRCQSDKGNINITQCHHNYTTFYHTIMKDRKDEKLRIFELGLGTNNINLPSNMGVHGRPGASLYGWSEFFANAKVFGADIDKDILFNTDTIKTFYCDQLNPSVIKEMWSEPGLEENFDIIVEDGAHFFEASECFLLNSIHKLRKNGYYIIEDISLTEFAIYHSKIKEWAKYYPHLTFTLLQVPPAISQGDNNLLVVQYN